MKSLPNLTFIDLFSGIGGFRLAFEKLGAKCVFSSEIDTNCRKVYFDNFGENPSGDIRDIAADSIPDFDILLAGFPCQPFSYSGRLEGFSDKARGALFFDIARIIEHKKPKMFLLENVKGLKSHENGQTMKTILTILESLGYHLHFTIINSVKFGVPQNRDRWYCVGFLEPSNFKFPVGSCGHTSVKGIIDLNETDPKLRLSQLELDRINHHFNSNDKRVQHDNSLYAPTTKKGRHGVYSYLKPDRTLRFHIGDKAKTQIQEAYYISIDSVAPSIIAAREPKFWDIKRRMSVKECKRLQGFPEWFKLNVADSVAKRQLGNAVTIPVIEAIGENMISVYIDTKANRVSNFVMNTTELFHLAS